MFETIQKMTEESQKASKETVDATLRSFAEINKGWQAITAEVADYSKKSFEDGTRAFEQLIGAKSVEQAVEIQSQYAKKAFEMWTAEVAKLREMYAALATEAYKPVEQAAVRRNGASVAAAA
jgi:hypothetical protein